MQDVSDKLLGQFVECLEQRLGGSAAIPTDEVVDSEPAEQPERPWIPAQEHAPPKHLGEPREETPPRADDSIDLGTAVLPVLVKSYWKPAVGAGSLYPRF